MFRQDGQWGEGLGVMGQGMVWIISAFLILANWTWDSNSWDLSICLLALLLYGENGSDWNLCSCPKLEANRLSERPSIFHNIYLADLIRQCWCTLSSFNETMASIRTMEAAWFVAAPALCNEVPCKIQVSPTLQAFWRTTKTCLFIQTLG